MAAHLLWELTEQQPPEVMAVMELHPLFPVHLSLMQVAAEAELLTVVQQAQVVQVAVVMGQVTVL